ncbi:DegV family protein [Tahibacter amnicola]|uniref:DegV family EDD domain-containing protein n=1 Tax=Tahibacter amnicola TaxID=2976241 RepID=A0ABY6BD19_9GAMM|nr:DegV family protein [Tahibacter amnicola]UXI67939.1 DegV family EDD domain-containing protein [Tahibacter amnicola]
MTRPIPAVPATPSRRAWRPGGAAFKRGLLAGIRRVLSQRDAINRINVFPVPDGDTGSNLAFTLSAVAQGLQALRRAGAGALLRRAADEAIDGARGNSGAILAQFLQGAGEGLGDRSRLSVPDLAVAAGVGAAQARLAVAEPREGTMLSVIAAFAASLRQQADRGADFRDGWTQALAAARDALAHTPDQLAVLRRAGVVDAGARGFVDLLEGIDEFIRRGRAVLDQAVSYSGGEAGVIGEAHDPDATHRYCTECIVSGTGVDRTAIRAAIETVDHSSLVLAGTREKLRVHVHVDEPERLYAVLAPHGAVSACKADDMRAQQRSAAVRTPVAVVTDSAADVPASVLETLPLHLVPVRLNFGAHDFLDKVSLSPEEFFRYLRESAVPPRTSQPPPGDFRRLFEFLLSHHESVVYVGLSRAVSGTLQAGETAASRTDAQRVSVIDTRTASCAQGLLAQYAAELASAGRDATQIRQRVEALAPRTSLFAYVRDLSHAVRGGRIPAWGLILTRWLGLIPVAAMGRGGRLGFARFLRKGDDLPERFAAWVCRRVPASGRWRVRVGHAENADEAVRVAAALQQRLRCESLDIVAAGAAISAHAGPGSIVVGLLPVPEET